MRPRVADKFQEKVQWRQLKKDQPTRGRDADILWGPSSSQGEMSERGDYEGHTMESSLYTKASMHPLITAASLVGAGLAVAALIGIASQREREPAWREAAHRPVRAAQARPSGCHDAGVSLASTRDASRANDAQSTKACFEYTRGTAVFVLGHTRGQR